ncbi:hypothetical protein RJ639_045786 [Escallonia herrerae]|uniref:Mal d 1-associated protein n=1 Tax=Escallonia herrerae TaxID=1293975 RepID=A0AA88W9C2_9ASTE|nr:hypothetical protein RJ639_045786 [Escallonia herrerae]
MEKVGKVAPSRIKNAKLSAISRWREGVDHGTLRRCFLEKLKEQHRPSDVVQSNKEYTEEDLTDQMVKGSFPLESPEHGLFDFPGLRSDMEAIERNIFGGMSRFFEAAEEMKNGFFNVFGDPHMYDGDSSSSSSRRRGGIPIEGHHQKEASWKPDNNDGDVDLSGLARDV